MTERFLGRCSGFSAVGLALGLELAMALTGCTVGPNYHRPAVALPLAYTAPPASDLGSLKWWQVFDDPDLQQLVRKADANNPDLEIAAARIAQVQAQISELRASYLPQVDAEGNETLQRISPIGLPRNRTTGDPAGSANIFGAVATWEIDFWGKYRRANEEARAALLAGKDAREAVLTTLLADVASAYFDLLSLDEQLRLAHESEALQRRSLELTRARRDVGVAPTQDVRHVEASIETEAKTIATLRRRIVEREDELRFLTGETTGPIARGRTIWQEQLPDLGPGLPSTLLIRRPDVREAEQNLIAANAQIGVAESAYFPNISLTAAGGQESTAFHNLISINASTFLLQPQINVPIFTAGRIRARVDQARAEQQAQAHLYQGTVIGAFRDVSNALAFRTAAQTAGQDQKHIVEQQADIAMLERRRLQAGVSSAIVAIRADEAELEAKRTLAADREEQLTSVVQLYRALGGGWQP